MKDKIKFWKESIKELGNNSDLEELESYSEEVLHDAFYQDLKFGTAGLRGKIGIGPNRMNEYIVSKVSYGFGKYVLKKFGENASIVISYDNRYKSDVFSRLSANIFARLGLNVYLFDKLHPTPVLSFAIRYLKADAGLMVTASHNPNDYNGYKVYDETGCQIGPKDIVDVIKEIDNVQDFFKVYDNGLILDKNVKLISKEVDDAYLNEVRKITVNKLTKEEKGKLKVVFTPLHGTGSVLTSQFLKEEGYDIVTVDEQMVNDPMFTTCPYPNPEEEKAYDLALQKARNVNADVVIATDPDADRMGIAIKNKDGKYVLLSGNQTGALILDYLGKYKEHDKNAQVFSTIVTSEAASLICAKRGMNLTRTLTGFKFIGEKAREIEGTEKKFFFGYEESYGYVISDFVRDKDSIQACFILLEMAMFYNKMGKSLLDVLDETYEEYGYFFDKTISLSFEGEEGLKKMKMIMESLRESVKNKTLFKIDKYECKLIEDYEDSKKYYSDGRCDSIDLPKSDVLKFILKGNAWVCIRPSGTEPKVKLYFSIVSSKDDAIKIYEDIFKYFKELMK